MSKVISISLDPHNTYRYSIQMSKSTGTFTYAVIASPPAIKAAVTLEGYAGTVERVGPVRSFGEYGYEVKGRISPAFTNAFISINKPASAVGTAYSAVTIAQEVAAQAGINLNILVADAVMKEYTYTGRFLSALESLASSLCGELIQTTLGWAIVDYNYSSGEFRVNPDDIQSFNKSDQADIRDEIMSLADELKNSVIAADDLAKQIAAIENEIDKETARADLEPDLADPTYSYLGSGGNSLGNFSFEFGYKNSDYQQLDPSIELEGGDWDTWTPDPNSSQNPDKPLKRYYQIQPVVDSDGEPTGEIRGCYHLFGAKIRMYASKPSNASGLYFIKGKSVNLFPSISNSVWFSIGWDHKPAVTLSDGKAVQSQEIYFEFSPVMPDEPDFGHNFTNPDKQLYRLDAVIHYLPAITTPWKFVGTLDQTKWTTWSAGAVVGLIDIEGTLYGLDGSETGTVLDDAELATLGLTVGQSNIVVNQEGFAVTNLTSEFGPGVTGSVEQVSTLEVYEIKTGAGLLTRIVGLITGGLIEDYTWPGVNPDPMPDPPYDAEPLNFYHQSDTLNDDDRSNTILEDLEDDLAKLVLDAQILAAKIACIKKQLAVYSATIATDVEASADLWIAYNALYNLDPKNSRIWQAALDSATASDIALATIISSLTSSLIVTSYTLIYNNVLPRPLNSLEGSPYGAGIIQDFSFTISNSSAVLTLTTHETI